jgi:hypothetical protein
MYIWEGDFWCDCIQLSEEQLINDKHQSLACPPVPRFTGMTDLPLRVLRHFSYNELSKMQQGLNKPLIQLIATPTSREYYRVNEWAWTVYI